MENSKSNPTQTHIVSLSDEELEIVRYLIGLVESEFGSIKDPEQLAIIEKFGADTNEQHEILYLRRLVRDLYSPACAELGPASEDIGRDCQDVLARALNEQVTRCVVATDGQA